MSLTRADYLYPKEMQHLKIKFKFNFMYSLINVGRYKLKKKKLKIRRIDLNFIYYHREYIGVRSDFINCSQY